MSFLFQVRCVFVVASDVRAGKQAFLFFKAVSGVPGFSSVCNVRGQVFFVSAIKVRIHYCCSYQFCLCA
mgnify:CR=1 FL=1